MTLLPGFKVINHESTPSGYYQITFDNGRNQTIIVTQHGRGGSNFYTQSNGDVKADFDEWLGKHDAIVYDIMNRLGYAHLGQIVLDRGTEWQDIAVMAILDLVELGEA